MTGATLWFTGLSGSGKSTIAAIVTERLRAAGRVVVVLDGDDLRAGLNADLGFSPADRAENIRRIGHVACLVARAGGVAVVPVISPYAADRAMVRGVHDATGTIFIEIHVATPIEVCEGRDPKGLYRRARAGELPDFTGVDAPYEPPEAPEVRLDTMSGDPESSAAEVLDALARAER